MSKKTTTDFRRIIQGQQLRTTHSNPNAGEIVIRIDDILSAVSELVEECKPNVKCIDKTIEGFAKSFVDEYAKNLLEALGK